MKGLAAEGLDAAPKRPRPVTLYDLRSAAHVVTFGCDVTPEKGQPVESWDVPAASEGYDAARAKIVEKVERLVAGLAGGR